MRDHRAPLPCLATFHRARCGLSSATNAVTGCVDSRPPARRLSGFALGAVLLVAGRAHAAEYYVSPSGSDSNAGTMAQPFASLQKGNDVAAAGDTVWLRGGTYRISQQIKLSKSGQSDAKRINYWAYTDEKPLLDLSGIETPTPASDSPGVLVTGSWLYLRGLEIANLPIKAPLADGTRFHSNSGLRTKNASHNVFELLNLHHNGGPGFFIDGGEGGNLVLNCDSHDNYDKEGSQKDGQNGDGFGCHYQTTGTNTVFRGCRAWWNSDDGYDLIGQEFPVIIEDSWAMANGYINAGTAKPTDGNGNGFKAGSSKTGVRHTIRRSVAWKNTAAGFYANHSSGGNDWYNNTSYMNGAQYNMLASSPEDAQVRIVLTGDKVHRLRNNIGFPDKRVDMETGVDSLDNTWDLGITEMSADDFASVTDDDTKGPRRSDGSLPAVPFLKLRAGSPLIDKGMDVGLPYTGKAPDLGAYEYGAITDAGAAGSSGHGGDAGGSGGAGGSAEAGVDASAGMLEGRDASVAGAGGASGAGGAGGASGSGGAGGAGGANTTSSGSGGSGGAALGSGGSATAGSAAGGPSAADGAKDGAMDVDGGCACDLGARRSSGSILPLGMLVTLGLLLRRRR